ncbi:Secreted frizzled protein 2 [Fasciola gigantica]|uniref:Secreted frizzled protein 2 n=1 Tax=Fasciola gigantica TaxID=46835 RepID=A0A504YWX3_FASGI|nr:Secreted frizzled protein 2 [Fasciola gigantica]
MSRTYPNETGRAVAFLGLLVLTLSTVHNIDAVVPFLRSYSYSKNQPNPSHFVHNRPSVWMTKYTTPLNQRPASDQPTADTVLFGAGSSLEEMSDATLTRDSLSPALNAVDPGTYYADWHQMLHGQGTHRCLAIPPNMSLCQNVGYRRMVLPNYLQHEELKEAVDQSQVWVSLAHTECHPDLKKFLCALYAPVCVEEFPEQLIHPCSDLCEDVRQSCLPKMLQFGFGWPEIVKCSRFPASSSKMCVPLTAKKRPRCSGCVAEPTFESIVSSYCMADVALRARIVHVSRTNHSTASAYLQLDRKPKIFKLATNARRSPSLNIEVSCDCGILDGALEDEKGRLGRWLIMGKLSADQKTLQVEHLSRIRKQNHGLKRALRAIRRPSSNLCRLTLPNSRHPGSKSLVNEPVTPEPTTVSIDPPQANHVNKRATPRLRARAHMYEPRGNRGSVYREYRAQTTAPSRRSLVRRSQKYSGRPALPMVPYASYATQTPRFAYSVEWPRTTRPFSGHIIGPSGLDPPLDTTITSGNRLLETENDLFAPQNLVPWL